MARNPAGPINDIMLMISLKPPRRTSCSVWGGQGPTTLDWEDRAEIIDIHVNGKPFQGLARSRIDINLGFSSRPWKGRSFLEKLMGVMPSYWADFFIGYEGHYCLFMNLDLAHFDHLSKCDTLIVSSREMRNDKGKLINKPLDYEDYSKQRPTSVISFATFYNSAELEDGGGKRKPKPSLQSYFESMPEQHRIFN